MRFRFQFFFLILSFSLRGDERRVRGTNKKMSFAIVCLFFFAGVQFVIDRMHTVYQRFDSNIYYYITDRIDRNQNIEYHIDGKIILFSFFFVHSHYLSWHRSFYKLWKKIPRNDWNKRKKVDFFCLFIYFWSGVR